MIKQTVIISSLTLLVSACVTNDELAYDMGVSLHRMEQQQIYNHQAAENPPQGIVNGVDGRMAEGVINSYQASGKRSKSSEQEIHFKMGSKR